MSAMLALRLVTYLLVSDGIAALYLAGLIGPVGVALVVTAILVSWALERARDRGALRPAVAWGLVGTAAVAIAIDLVYLAQTLLDGMVHLLLFLILVRLFMHRVLRDLRDAGFLSFFLLIAASSVTFSAGFIFVFVIFLLLVIWMLMLHHVVAESERAGYASPEAAGTRLGLRSPLMRVSLAAAAGTFVLAGLLFFIIPRVGQAALPFRPHLGKMVTGFTDRVELGAFGDIETDRTVVMRVYFPDETGDPERLPNLRWRGLVFDRFDGRTWTFGQTRRILVGRSTRNEFQLNPAQGRRPVVRQEVFLDPIGTDVVFGAPRVLRMDLRVTALAFDDMGSVFVPSATARLHYVVDSELELPRPPDTRVPGAGTGFTESERRRYLQLPALSPLIPKLARETTAGSRDPYEAALRLTAFLSKQYKYTLGLKRQTQLEPLEEFLFVRRSGNCEYFAASLAVMLRTLGIPARVVAGFQRGEWNPYGRYFMVTLADAHSWVEAYFDGLGWITLDPSPRAEAEAETWQLGTLSLYVDAARMRWYRYVINWSLQDQMIAAATVQRQASDLRLALHWPRDWRARPWLVGAAVAAGALALAWLAWRLRLTVAPTGSAARMPGFYERALRLLARRGLEPEPAETARQFCGRVRGASPGLAEPIGRLTEEYERARFGAAALTEPEMREVERCLAALERA
jgi:transglutaminase-like putative cysteine protease